MSDVKAGRPTDLTPELQDRICNFLRAGAYVETAAQACGVNKTTLYLWLKRGAKEPGTPFEAFSNAVQEAMAYAELRDIRTIDSVAIGAPAELDKEGRQIRPAIPADWKAAAWRLERKFPKRWGRKQQIQHFEGGEGSGEFKQGDFHSQLLGLMEEINGKGETDGEEDDQD
jgi:hypothetical protein